MFTSDWKSIRCEEVLKKHGQDQSHNPEFLRRSLGTSERTPPPQPRYSKWGWGDFSGREVRVCLSWAMFLPVDGIPWHSLRSVATHQFISVEPPKKKKD